MSDTYAAEVDLTDLSLYERGVPHDVFAELRARGGVHHHRGHYGPNRKPIEFWSVVRHAEVQQANRDWQAFSAIDGPGIERTRSERRGTMIVAMDPPDHTRHRKLISAGFTPRMIGRLEERIRTWTDRILDAVEARGEFDLVSDVAYQLPMHVIADIVGIPESDREWVFDRTEILLQAFSPASGVTLQQRAEAEVELFSYAQRLGREKRERPADDVWTILAHAETDAPDGSRTRLSELELDLFFLILSVAGSETTRNAISQGVMALLEHSEQLEELRRDPSLMATAADEMIRWASPVLYFGRTATRDVELGSRQIREGDRVVLWYASANRDEAAFEDPFRFDVRRDPNHHVAFGGGGPHYCLGASLARKEVQVMVGELVRRFRTIEPAGDPVWSLVGPTVNVGVSLERFPVRVSVA